MITTINEFRKFYENNYPEGDFIKYNYNDTPDVEEYMNQAASAMGEMTDSLYWFETQELEELAGIVKDITGDESYDFDKVEAYSTKQGTVKIYITSDTGAYFIICNTNMNGKKIVDDQIVDIYQNDYSEVTPEDSNDFKGYGNGENGEDDVDPAGGTGLASHESKYPSKLHWSKKNKINEGAYKRHWEEIMNAIEAKLPLEYISGENHGTAIPVEYKDNIVSFNNGIHVIDSSVKTSINKLNDNNN